MFMRFLTIMSILCFFVSAKSEEREKIEENPRSMAVGGVSMLSSTFENPSLSALGLRTNLSVFYESKYLMSELGTGKCMFQSPQEWGTVGFAISGFGYDRYNRLRASGQYARFLSPSLALGVGVDLHSYYYEGVQERLFRFGFRFGALFNVSERLVLSAWNDSRKRLKDGKFVHRISGGGSLNLKSESRWLFEVETFQFDSWQYRTGFEYKVGKFFMRCGARALPVEPSLGVGFDLSSFAFDFSASYHNQLGLTICGGTVFTF